MKYGPADVLFVAGEASGDLQASLLANSLRGAQPGLRIAAVGGERLRAAGVTLVYDSSELASIGPLSIIPRIPLLYLVLRGLERAIRTRPPQLFVPVDIGAVNLRLVGSLRSRGYRRPIVYYFPPGAWLDDSKQASKVAQLTLPVTPFVHQRDFYRRLGLRVEYFGHPLVSVIETRAAKPIGRTPRIAVLPGSRREEVDHHVPVLARAAREIGRIASGSFVSVAASDERALQIRRLWERCGGPAGLSISRENTTHVLRDSDLAWIASGTAVLEAALVGVPQIAFYQVSPVQYQIAMRRISHLLPAITLPNLVLGRHVIPEMLQAAFNSPDLVKRTVVLLERDDERDRQLQAYGELRIALGPPDALARIASFALSQLSSEAAS